MLAGRHVRHSFLVVHLLFELFSSAVRLYLRGLGGSHPTLFFATFVGGLFVTELSNAAQTWYLGYWASQYNDKDPAEIPVF